MTTLEKMFAVERRGLICVEGQSPSISKEIQEIASNVSRSSQDNNSFIARSATEAAAWLLFTSNYLLGGNADSTYNVPLPDINSWKVGGVFRGQKKKYSTVVPTFCRASSRQEREQHSAALRWLHPLAQAFHDKCFKYHPTNKFSDTEIKPSFWFSSEDVAGIGQHHGISTHLVDWTFDPLIALVFAGGKLAELEQGVVLFNEFASSYAMLPPTSLTRLWRQAGCFSEAHCCCIGDQYATCKHDLVRMDTKHLLRLEFSTTSTDERATLAAMQADLMSADKFDSMQLLVDQSLKAAVGERDTPKQPPWTSSGGAYGDEVLYLLKLANDSIFSSTLSEDVEVMLDRMEMASMRLQGNKLGYDIGALGRFMKNLGSDATIISSSNEFMDAVPNKWRRLAGIARGPEKADRFVSIAKFGGQNAQWLSLD